MAPFQRRSLYHTSAVRILVLDPFFLCVYAETGFLSLQNVAYWLYKPIFIVKLLSFSIYENCLGILRRAAISLSFFLLELMEFYFYHLAFDLAIGFQK